MFILFKLSFFKWWIYFGCRISFCDNAFTLKNEKLGGWGIQNIFTVYFYFRDETEEVLRGGGDISTGSLSSVGG